MTGHSMAKANRVNPAGTDYAERLIAEARRRIGTPYSAGGRAGEGGLDCFGLIYEVARSVGLAIPDALQCGSYPEGDPARIAYLNENLRYVGRNLDGAGIGDVLAFSRRTGADLCHLCFLSNLDNGPSIIHVARHLGCVQEEPLSVAWMRCLVGVHRFRSQEIGFAADLDVAPAISVEEGCCAVQPCAAAGQAKRIDAR